jgi:phage protein U
MINVMMRLGDFRFSISTAAYQSFSRSNGYRWQGQERFGQLPAQQYTGPGEHSISLSGDIYPDFSGAGLKQIDAMREEAIKGLPLILVDGNGYVWGRWVIQSIEDQQGVFFSDGTPRKMAFTLKIVQYGEDL